jgi:wyosine [tRNA(Phe)-imidazoG37] synthetase (radical SAM superfamily)
MKGESMRRITLPTSKEERVATTIGKLLSDFTLDLEAVGKYLAVVNPHVIYVRTLTVLEATEYNKTVSEYRERGKYYEDNLRSTM